MDVNENVEYSFIFFFFLVGFARPFWLSPRQVMVVPVGPTSEEYAQQVRIEHYIVSNFSSSCCEQ